MRYKAVFTDEFLSYFRLDDNGKTLVLTDRQGFTRAVTLEDEVEPKCGKWIKMSDADGVYWACSECGEDIPRVAHYNPQFDLFPRLESIDRTRFCPNCGARMDRGEERG